MSGKISLLVLAVIALLPVPAVAQFIDAGPRLMFTGDILLSRNVEVELAAEKSSPWRDLQPLFLAADFMGGNLEGAVGPPASCEPGKSPCFAVAESRLDYLASAGFKALSIENNHAGDLGEPGRGRTSFALEQRNIVPLNLRDSPQFLRIKGITVGFVTLNMVDSGSTNHPLPSIELAQKLRLAHQLSNLVVVSIHWGTELMDWPSPAQRQQAEWLVAHGADLVLGHHPHVVQAPECVAGKPVFFSLGNHLFDQKYPETKTGMIADCRIDRGKLVCGALNTHSRAASFRPELAGSDQRTAQALASCTPELRADLKVTGQLIRPEPWKPRRAQHGTALSGWKRGRQLWATPVRELLSIESEHLAGANGPEFLITLERHFSPIDKENAVRPYVYEVAAHGLIARWRGSALAWPLLDAMVLPGSNLLCALHRGDSFVAPDPTSSATRTALYRWNGFGFAGVEDSGASAACNHAFAEFLPAPETSGVAH